MVKKQFYIHLPEFSGKAFETYHDGKNLVICCDEEFYIERIEMPLLKCKAYLEKRRDDWIEAYCLENLRYYYSEV